MLVESFYEKARIAIRLKQKSKLCVVSRPRTRRAILRIDSIVLINVSVDLNVDVVGHLVSLQIIISNDEIERQIVIGFVFQFVFCRRDGV
jgi:hypothetical protein